MKVNFNNSKLVFRSLSEQVINRTFTNWPSQYYITHEGVVKYLSNFTNVGVSDPVNCEGYSKLRITGCVGTVNNYASICAFFSEIPVADSAANRTGNQIMTGDTTTYEVNIPAGSKYVVTEKNEHTSGGTVKNSDLVFTLVP